MAMQKKDIMKKILGCVGLAAAGTASLQVAYASDLNSMETTKLWSLSGTLRSFYDDNYNTAPSGPYKRSSYGFEVSPSFSLNVPLQQTEFGLRYTYGLYYYQDRQETTGKPIDQTHQADLWIDHAFSETWKTKIQDSFVMGQDPELISGGGTLLRANGNNIHNNGAITLDSQWTRLLGSEVGYQNNLYDYENSGGNVFNPSLAGRLNRIEHLISLNVNWCVLPTTKVLVGYQYGQINYIGNEPIGIAILPSMIVTYHSDNRDNRSHYGFAGVQCNPLENLSVAARGGIQYIDFYNPPDKIPSTSQVSPYANLSATYTYLPGSYAQVGFQESRNATDVVAPGADGKITEDQESSMIYASINHRLTSQLTGNVTGNLQYSTFQSGAYNNQSQTMCSLGLNLSYRFNPHVSAEIGYNFDDLVSDVPGQQYKRNRAYVGVTSTY
jgi:Putative beta-barrel porin 2